MQIRGLSDVPLISRSGELRTVIKRTGGGVPHIQGSNLASVAYGAGYVQAQDNICLIAEAILKARGERALYFGPGGEFENVISDFSYLALALGNKLAEAKLSAEGRILLDGFVQGYNRYLSETAPDKLPPACRNQPWVKPITSEDLYSYHRTIAQFASGDFFAFGALFSAVPPGMSVEPRMVAAGGGADAQANAARLLQLAAPGRSFDNAASVVTADTGSVSAIPDYVETYASKKSNTMNLASNAWAIGKELSENGRGALLANPHFPYSGPRRFYQMHLKVPGHYDVNGVGLLGVPIPQIGFNSNIAWTHTVSPSFRFTLYELTLADSAEPGYIKDGEVVPFDVEKLSIDVTLENGDTISLQRDFYFSEYGPMIAANLVSQGALPAWGQKNTAYTYRDASASPDPILETWFQIGSARSIDEFQAIFENCGSTLWTNSIYTDDSGNAFYIDSSSVPNLSMEALQALQQRAHQDPILRSLLGKGVIVLDGSSSRDDWVEGQCGSVIDYPAKPKLLRSDFVQNSNDSFWLTNPRQLLTGFSPLYGLEGSPVGARTQLGLRMLLAPEDTGFAASSPAGDDGLFGARELLDVIWNNRALHAEDVLPELRVRCELIGATPVVLPEGQGARPVDAGCDVLADWQGVYDVDSKGAHLFRVFFAQLSARQDIAGQQQFNPEAPLEPTWVFDDWEERGTAADKLLQSLAVALQILEFSGVGFDVALGDVQNWTPSGGVPPSSGQQKTTATALSQPIPWHGGHGELDGTFNVAQVVPQAFAVGTRFPRVSTPTISGTGGLSQAQGNGWAIGQGTSWHFGLEFTDDGPEAYGLLSHSQSADHTSANFIDQSLAYSRKEPRRLLYKESDIDENMIPGSELELIGRLSQ